MKSKKWMLGPLAGLALAGCAGDDGDKGSDGSDGVSASLIQLRVAGTYQPPGDVFAVGAAEIVTHDPETQRLYVVNADALTVDVLDISDVSMPGLIGTIDASAEGGAANSVAVRSGIVAVAIEAATKTDNGKVVFYNGTGLGKIGEATVGALPDMLVFTPDGSRVLVANEGEPSDDYSVDPEGSISIIDISSGVGAPGVSTATFSAFNGSEADLRAAGVRIFGPGATAAQDLEPEYLAISPDGATAWATLQEANAVAVVDIGSATVTDILPLGFKNHYVFGNELDASDRDGRINIRSWPIFGMYLPDSIRSYAFNGDTYYVTANEGDSREYDTWSEEFRVKDLVLDAIAFPDGAALQQDEAIGRLKVTSTLGVSNGCDPSNPATDVGLECEYNALYSYGARSFSIRKQDGTLVYDSGNDFERLLALRDPANFNSDNEENDSFDNRSDDKGPEPEGLALGTIRGQTYAFVGLERMGGLVVYNITNPESPFFVQYLNNRDFAASQLEVESGAAGDLAPEGLAFISAANSPTGRPLLAVGNEVSGTTTLYEIDVLEL